MTRALSLDYLWIRRSFVWSLVYKDIRNRYAHSMLGLAWMVFEPLLLVLALSLISHVVGRIGPMGATDVPFPIFFYAGILPWNLFSRSLNEGSRTFVNEAVLMRKYSFPREILIGKSLVIFLIELTLASAAFAVVMAIYQFPPNAQWLWLLPIVAIESVLCLGIMLLTASLNVYVRDVGTFLSAVTGILFWLSPVIYRIDQAGPAAPLLYANPISGIIEACRTVVLDGAAPAAVTLAVPAVWAAALLTLGYGVFRRLEKGFVDVV